MTIYELIDEAIVGREDLTPHRLERLLAALQADQRDALNRTFNATTEILQVDSGALLQLPRSDRELLVLRLLVEFQLLTSPDAREMRARTSELENELSVPTGFASTVWSIAFRSSDIHDSGSRL
jgi:hypothetical protein